MKYTSRQPKLLFFNSTLSAFVAVAVLVTASFVAYRYFNQGARLDYRPEATEVPILEQMSASMMTEMLPIAKVGQRYEGTLQISIPAGYYQEEVTLGNLPAGLEMTGCAYMDGREAPEPISYLECTVAGTPTAATGPNNTVNVTVINEVKGLLLTDGVQLVVGS